VKNILSSKKSIWVLVNTVVFIILAVILYVKQGSFKATAPIPRVVAPDDVDAQPTTGQTVDTTTTSLATVARVIDGDTIELTTGERVRYIGIDTPETKDPRKAVQCFGKEASAHNKELVLGQKVRLEKDISNEDRYHRLLRYVYLEDGTFLNLALVTDGYARAATFPPDVKYAQVFVEAERAARTAGRGLWGKCR
jgi:micrococcal nuclease